MTEHTHAFTECIIIYQALCEAKGTVVFYFSNEDFAWAFEVNFLHLDQWFPVRMNFVLQGTFTIVYRLQKAKINMLA